MKRWGMFCMTLCALSGANSYSSQETYEKASHKKIVVIGAGIAGLTAAYRLHKKGFDVEVYEARGRVGGRILSGFIDDKVVEFGGQNFFDGGDAQNLNQLIQEFELPLVYYSSSFNYFFHHDNTLLPVDELIKKHNFNPETLEEQLDVIAQNSASMQDVLDQLFKSDEVLKTYFGTRLAGYEGGTADQLSSMYVKTLYHMIQGGTCAVHQKEEYVFGSIADGNSKLPEAIAKKLGDRVLLNMPLTSMAKNKERQYLLTFQDGFTTIADIVVIAVPCPIYNDISFGEEVIPSDRLALIRAIHNGSNAKIVVPVLEGLPKSIALINEYLGIFSSGRGRLTLYFTGQSSFFDADTIAQTYTRVKPLLVCGFDENSLPNQEPVFAKDELFRKYSGPVGYSWPNDPFAQGTYSYIAPAQNELFALSQAENGFTVKNLFAPIDQQLYFAGEHASTLIDVPGTMEAACQSGNLVADMIEHSLL